MKDFIQKQVFKEIRDPMILVNQGKKLFCTIHRPQEANAKCPAILICSGFGGNKCGKYNLFVTLAVELTRKGFVVLRFDYRGTGDSEGLFSEMTIESEISDTLTCLEYLKNDSQVDSGRICLLGNSLGGLVGILSANRFETLKSLVLWAPVYVSEKWKNLWHRIANGPSETIEKGITQLMPNIVAIPNREFLTQFFSYDLKNELKQLQNMPILHIYGLQDITVPRDQTDSFKLAMTENANYQLILLKESDHGFKNVEERNRVISETCLWFEKTI